MQCNVRSSSPFLAGTPATHGRLWCAPSQRALRCPVRFDEGSTVPTGRRPHLLHSWSGMTYPVHISEISLLKTFHWWPFQRIWNTWNICIYLYQFTAKIFLLAKISRTVISDLRIIGGESTLTDFILGFTNHRQTKLLSTAWTVSIYVN